MARHECDCGRVYDSFDGISACQASNHYLPCTWELSGDEDEPYYQTQCGNAFEITDGDPKANGMRFCCYCGASLSVVEPEDFVEPYEDDGPFEDRDCDYWNRLT